MDQGYELRLADIRKAAFEEVQNTDLYIPLYGKHTTNPDEVPFDLAEKINSFFVFDETSISDPKVMLLMGDTGSGKSVFSQQLHQQLWMAYKSGNPIPLWIPLPELQNPFEGAVEEVLKKYEFSEAQISEIKPKEKFIFIVDGYDELHQFQNCYVTNKWHQWNAKVLMTCRFQALYYQKDPDKYFMPFNGEKRLPLLLRRLYVAPFSKEQISAYIKKYQQLNTEHKISEEDFVKVPGLTELINTPFLLHLAVESLPDILADQVDNEKMTQAKLYDVFIERWFTRQVEKLSAAGLLKETEQTAKQQFWDYCKRLAQQMHKKQVSVIPYLGQKVGRRLFGKQEQSNIWEGFFNEETEVLRSACPLKRVGDHNYGFVHASMIEYFATRAMYENIQQNKLEEMQAVLDDKEKREKEDEPASLQEVDQFKSGIHYRVFSQERNAIQFLADRIEMSEAFKQKMLGILEASKKSLRFANGAANAITAMVRAGMTFNGVNLSGIKISGADISGGYFDQADLTGADLQGCQLNRVWLRRARLVGCQLEGVSFGEYPYFQHDRGVSSIDYRPEINRLVTGSNKSVYVWEIESGRCIWELRGHNSEVSSVSMSADGEKIASLSHDGMWVWDAQTGEAVVLPWRPASMHLSSDGRTVALGDLEGVRLCDVRSGEMVVLLGDDRYVETVHLSADGRMVASGLGKKVRVWDVRSGQSMVLRHDDYVTTVHLSADGRMVASGSWDKTVRVSDVRSGQSKVLLLPGDDRDVTTVHLSSDGRRVAFGFGETVRLWDVLSGKVVVLRGHDRDVTSVQFSVDGRTLASGSDDNTARVWSVGGHSDLLPGHNRYVNCVHLSGDGRTVASGGGDKTIRLWDVISGQSILLKGFERSISCVNLSGDGQTVAWGEKEYGWVQLWDVASGKSTRFKGHEDGVTTVHLSPDGRTLVSGGKDKRVRVWNVGDRKSVVLRGHEDEVTSVHLSADGRTVASGSRDRTVRVWGLESGGAVVIKGHYDGITSVYLSADGRKVVSGSDDKSVRLWDVETTKLLNVLRGHEDEVTSVHLSVDGETVTSGGGKIVNIWSMKRSRPSSIEFNSRVNAISVQEHTGLLAVGLEDSSVQLWKRLDGCGEVWQLQWSSNTTNLSLHLAGCDITGSLGLSSQIERLLIQRGAIDDSEKEKEKSFKLAGEEKPTVVKIKLKLGTENADSAEIIDQFTGDPSDDNNISKSAGIGNI